MANSIGGPSRLRTPDSDEPEAAPRPGPAPLRREYPLSPAADQRHDAALAEYVQNARGATGVAAPALLGPTNDQILYVGINPDSASKEADAMRKLRPDTKVVVPAGGDVAKHEGTSFDLATADGRAGFVAGLALPGEVAGKVAGVLANVSAGRRAAMAQIAVAWSTAERGGTIPSRLVLSGHSTGRIIYGGGNEIAFVDLQALGKAMPRAARQIEDIHLSGCFTSGHALENERWRDAFPNMKTLWGYDGYAPSAPVHHLAAWNAATTGRKDGLSPAPWLRDQAVASWSVTQGYVSKEVAPEVLARAKRAADTDFDRLMAGTPRIPTHAAEPARSHYETYSSLGSRPERSDRAELQRRAAQLFMLRNYEEKVRGKFQSTYASVIDRGFGAAGLEPPSFSEMTRAEAIAKSRELREAIARMNPAPEAARELETILRGLDTFNPRVIDPAWSR